MATILITGGSGMIGTRLTGMLLDFGHEVRHLERSARKSPVKTYVWNVEKGEIDVQALQNVDVVIHLAGASIGEGRWSEKRKKEILDSRVQSTQLLHRTLWNISHQVKTFLCASAIGYYGADCGDAVRTETDASGNDFLAEVTRQWEASASAIEALGIRVVLMRTGIVLSPNGGALAPMATQVRLGVGAPLGSGRQYMSWIHLDDHCAAFIHAMEHEGIRGAYNSVAPHPVTNATFTKALARVLGRPLLIPRIPAFAIRLVLGEMSVLVLGGCKVASGKLEMTGFVFRYGDVEEALRDVLKR